MAGGQRRLIFIRNVKTNLVNKYTAGSNIGGLNISVRRALKRRAVSAAGTMNKKGELLLISKLFTKIYSRNGQVTTNWSSTSGYPYVYYCDGRYQTEPCDHNDPTCDPNFNNCS